MRQTSLRLAILLFMSASALAQETDLGLTVDKAMTQQEFVETGVSSLNPAQRRALDRWLNRYTDRIIRAVARTSGSGSCDPAIESQIDGEFKGWDGRTVFRLANGQIWEQAEYAYTYEYAYMPEVVIYRASDGCRMKVEDVDETIRVRKIK